MAKAMRFIFVLSVFLIMNNSLLNAQQSIFDFTYCEWPDGCLTYQDNGHYDYNFTHRNDTAYVNGLLNDFNNLVRQYNAVPYEQGHYKAGDYVYLIDKSYYNSPAITRYGEVSGTTVLKNSENYTMYACSLFKVGGSASSVSSYSSGSSDSSFFKDFIIGYNYTLGMPIGLTIGVLGLYGSLNFNLSTFGDTVTSGDGLRMGVTGETTTDGLAFTVGYSIKLINQILRLPIGIGMSMTDEYEYYRDSYGNTGWYGNGNLEDKKFILEAGLMVFIFDLFYLSSTYRLIGFSKSNFTVGAGLHF